MSSQSTYLGRARDRLAQSSSLPRRASFTFPDRLKEGDDADIDVTAPKTRRGQYMNQSFLSMIANVGSNATHEPIMPIDVPPALAQDDSPYTAQKEHESLAHSRAALSTHLSSPDSPQEDPQQKRVHPPRIRKHESRLEAVSEATSSSQLLPQPQEDMTASTIVSPPDLSASAINARRVISGDGQSEDTTSSSHLSGGDSPRNDILSASEDSQTFVQRASVPDLPRKLAEIFGFENVEEVESDFPCWLLQSVLLQGHMYVTKRHVCFYAYLPRNNDATSKSGHLSKRGRQNPNFRRYWFVLKGSVLSYYADSSNLYFPRSTIDLRNALTAELESGRQSAGGKGFYISTPTRAHRFKADSVVSAQEWVKQISQAIFRARNDGDSVKVSLPIENMIDIDENPVLDFAETLKIRIIDNDETFAIDEYFFSFFGHGKDALEVLQAKVGRNAINQSAHQPIAQRADTIRSGPLRTPTFARGESLASPARSHVVSDTESESAPGPSATHEAEVDDGGGQGYESKTSASSDTSQSLDTSSVSASQILQQSDLYYHPSKQHRKKRAAEDSVQTIGDDALGLAKSTESESASAGPSSSQDIRSSVSGTRLQDLMRAGKLPLEKATGIADMLRIHSVRVRDALASESKVYYEKVTNMWAGKTMHFDDAEGLESAKADGDSDNETASVPKHAERFRAYFALPASEKLRASYHGYLNRGLPVFGKIYVSDRSICFRNLLPGVQTRMILPLGDVETVEKEKGFRFGYAGLVIVVRGHEELFLEFGNPDARDDLSNILLQSLADFRSPQQSQVLERDGKLAAEAARAEYHSLEEARKNSPKDQDAIFHSIPINDQPEQPPMIFDDGHASMIDFKPLKPQNITCLTVGSRGDVQPYIALCKGLMQDGHRCKIVTHSEFEPWIRQHGVDFAPVAGDPAEIMRLCVEHDMFTVSFLREATAKFRGWIDQLLKSAWEACQGTDILIESPSAMAGIHIAEALEIPYFRAFTMPWTRTRAYPHAFAVPSQKLGGNYNLLSYVMFDNVFWRAVAGQINRWRAQMLALPPTNLDRLQANAVPFLYNFSPSVVAPPLDFSPWIHVTGYWFLDEGDGYRPPPELAAFIAAARADGKKIVYVGFGSIVVDDPAALTQTIVDSVLRADVRCILSKGWSDRLEQRGPAAAAAPEVPLPPAILQIKSAPHDWLFARIDAAVHHGGAGTTGASLRAGIPTLVKPFFGDQFFFGSRIEDLGVGRCLARINTSVFARALWEVTNSQRLIVAARRLGARIRAEAGVERAVQALYRDLDYARARARRGAGPPPRASLDDPAEDWTMVGDESDADEPSP